MREVIGHEGALAQLAHAIAGERLGHAYLFTGPEGIGKTALARDVARLLECERPNLTTGDPCGECVACRRVAHGNHPDVTLIEQDEGKRGLGVEAVREGVIRLANLAPTSGRWRVFILPNVERMTANTVNALLKTLEEPPPGVTLLLTSAEPENLLPTLLSRCQTIPLKPLPTDQIAAALQERWSVEPREAQTLAGLANGRLGWAVRASQQPELREERAQTLEQLLALPGASRDERLRLAGKLAADGEAARRALDLWTLWWRDVTLVACGATLAISSGAARGEAERIGRALGEARAVAFLQRLLEARAALDANANPRLTLDVLTLDLPYVGAQARR